MEAAVLGQQTKHSSEMENITKRVLICDSDFMVANLIDQVFTKEFKAFCTIVEDGNEAVKEIEGNSYDLIITDLYLPYKSGYDIIQFLKESRKSSTPIIILTSTLTDDVITNACLLGADDFVRKPFNTLELFMRSRKLIMR